MSHERRLQLLGRLLLSFGVAIIGASALNAAQDKNTLWTKVSASGQTITLSWDKRHPWDEVLRTGGAELIARYWPDQQREYGQALGRVTIQKGQDRELRFTLPSALNRDPVGPVCLFVQLPDRRTLPIRPASAGNGDTAGFRYEAWEGALRLPAEVRAAQRRVDQDSAAVTSQLRRIAAQESLVSSRRWTTLAGCDAIAAPSANVGQRPADVLPTAQHDTVSRQVCVHRVWYGRELFAAAVENGLVRMVKTRDKAAAGQLAELFDIAWPLPEAAGPLLGELRQARRGSVDRARDAQAVEFLKDWNAWSGGSKVFESPIDREGTYLRWPTIAQRGAYQIFGRDTATQLQADWLMDNVPRASLETIEGVVGAALDAYFGCLSDVRKQLQMKYDNWQSLTSAAPQRAALARDFLVRECRQEVQTLDEMRTALPSLEAQLAIHKQELGAISAPPPLPVQAQPLNMNSCPAR